MQGARSPERDRAAFTKFTRPLVTQTLILKPATLICQLEKTESMLMQSL